MKRIGIDFLPVESSPAGIGQYTIGLLKALWDIDSENQYIVYSTKPIETKYLKYPNVKNTVLKWPTRFPFKGIRWMNSVIRKLMWEKTDIFLSTSNNYFALNFPHTIQFVHDLAPMHFPKSYKLNARILYLATTRLALKKALHVVTVSETIKKELIGLDKKAANKISVVYAFLNEKILENSEVFKTIKPETKYILTLSTLEPKKNMALSIEVFNELIKLPDFKDFKYYIIGKMGWHFQEILDTVERLGLREKVIFLGYGEDRYVADVMSRSKCMIALSKYEGFGITPLESLYFNVPVVVSDIPVFREVLSDLATYVDIKDIDLPEMAGVLAEAIRAGKVDTKDKVFKMYNANKSAKKLLEIINLY